MEQKIREKPDFLLTNKKGKHTGYWLYILKSRTSDKYYIGVSQNPPVKLHYHNNLEKGFTSRYRPWEIVFTKEFPDRQQAQMIEKKIKSWKSRIMVEKIISGELEI